MAMTLMCTNSACGKISLQPAGWAGAKCAKCGEGRLEEVTVVEAIMDGHEEPDLADLSTGIEPVIHGTSAERKEMPIFGGVLAYFPNAIAAIAAHSKINNDKHNPGEPMHWAREKSADHPECIARHLVDHGTFDEDGNRHSLGLAWRALALLEEELIAEGATPGRNAR